MHTKFGNILCCPKTGANLHLRVSEVFDDGTVKSGTLVNEEGTVQYPIVRGVPRFVDKELYAQSFGYEWRKWSRVRFESENVGGPMAGHTEKVFETITAFSEEFLKGKMVVEFGCGPGRFLDIVRRRGGIAVGIDMSMAVESARENFKDDPEVLIVQGDILNPPFRKESFDAGYTRVLHHTPDPAKGLKKLSGVVKEHRGSLVVCTQRKGFTITRPSPFIGRFITRASLSLETNWRWVMHTFPLISFIMRFASSEEFLRLGIWPGI